MRVSPRELQAVHRAGMLTRYSMFGPVVFVLADLPDGGVAGTGLDEPCLTEHHGIVLRGRFSVEHEDGRAEAFDEGTAFYVPAGPPTHTFTAAPGTVVGGFAPIAPTTDVTDATLIARGYEIVQRPKLPVSPPATVTLAGTVRPFRRSGAIDVVGSVMGSWIFMRSTLGPRSGYSSGWCHVPHWGMVLDGEITISYEGEAELASRGDAFYVDGAHRVSSPDGATLIDYTPIEAIGSGPIARWRQAAVERALGASPAQEPSTTTPATPDVDPTPERAAAPVSPPARATMRLRLAPT